jgi:Bacterial antitoxin of type II TA system, VapB
MKTTIEINDALLQRAKQLAVERKVTFREIVEAALRGYLDQTRQGSRPAFRLRQCSFGGQGLQPGLDENDWAMIRAMTYEGRGG